jgi:hypothetical protein
MKYLVPSLLVLVACSTQETPPAENTEVAPDQGEEAAVAVADTVLPPMPDYPARHKGHLVVTSVGALDTGLVWPAHAGRCQDPSLIVVIAEEEQGVGGASLLLRVLPNDTLAGTYPVVDADSTGVPEPPAARLGIQFLKIRRADTYQAVDGAVDVTDSDPSHVSGRFAVTLRHIGDEHLSRAAGVFDHVAVKALSPDWCGRVTTDHDSLPAGDP